MSSLIKVIDWKQKLAFADAAKSQGLELARFAFTSAADISPVGARAELFTGNRAFGFAFNLDRKLRSTLTMAVGDLS